MFTYTGHGEKHPNGRGKTPGKIEKNVVWGVVSGEW
jgi:hypothetical protein